MARRKILDFPFLGGSLEGLRKDSTIAEYDAGKMSPELGDWLDQSGNGLDLTPSGNPLTGDSSVQQWHGNRIQSRVFDGVGDYYSRSVDQDIWSKDFAITALVKGDVGLGGGKRFFTASFVNAFGFDVGVQASTIYFYAVFWGGATVIVIGPAIPANDGLSHLVRVVRDSNIATVFVDGVAGTPVDVSGQGVYHASNSFSLGAQRGASQFWEGAVSYFRLDSEVPSINEAGIEFAQVFGIAGSVSNKYKKRIDTIAATFSRASTAYMTFSTRFMAEIAANIPRVGGPGGGVLIEGQDENICLQTQTFDSGTWSKTRSSILANQAIAPDGTLTADAFREDSTAANNHFIRISGTLNQITNSVYTQSLFVKAIGGLSKDWIRLLLVQSGADPSAYYDAVIGVIGTTANVVSTKIKGYANDWKKITQSWTALVTETFDPRILLSDGDGSDSFDGILDQIDHYIWGYDIKLGLYPKSYIPTTTVPVTRTADSLTIDPKDIPELPEVFDEKGILTIEFDMIAEFSEASELVSAKYLVSISGNIGTASGNDNRLESYIDAAGRFTTIWRNNSTSEVWRSIADPVNYAEWHKYKTVIDFSDMTKNKVYIDKVDATDFNNASGADVFDLSGTLVRVGIDFNSDGHGDCQIRNFRAFLGD